MEPNLKKLPPYGHQISHYAHHVTNQPHINTTYKP